RTSVASLAAPNVPCFGGSPPNLKWDPRGKRWKVPDLPVTLVGHFLRVDFCRIFGSAFINSLRTSPADHHGRVAVESRRLLRFIERRGRGRDRAPILQYVYHGRNFHAVRVETRDTMLPFGYATL